MHVSQRVSAFCGKTHAGCTMEITRNHESVTFTRTPNINTNYFNRKGIDRGILKFKVCVL